MALRDANLKTLPSAVTELGPLARTLDASNNKIGEGLRKDHIISVCLLLNISRWMKAWVVYIP